MNVKARLAKANQKYHDDDEAKNNGQSDVLELELAAVLGDGAINLEKGEREDRKNDGELRDTESGRTDCIDNEPGMSKPGDFGEEKAKSHGHESVILLGALDEDMVGGGKADYELGEDENPGFANGGENTGGGSTEEDSDERLNNGKSRRGAGLNNN